MISEHSEYLTRYIIGNGSDTALIFLKIGQRETVIAISKML